MKKIFPVSTRLLQYETMQRCKLGECQAACCLHGVWLDSSEVADLLNHKDLISPCMPPKFQNPSAWFENREENDPFSRSGRVVHSSVVKNRKHYGGTACVFLRSDFKCALQVAGQYNGLHPWRFKPFYCILHPLDLTENGEITLDCSDALLDEPASCLRPALQAVPLIITFEPELRYLLGDQAYQDLLKRLEEEEEEAA